MNVQRIVTKLLALFVALAPAPAALADPCGMVPPVYLGQGRPITRVGVQKTYVFYRGGIESIVIRPGFSGQVHEFGMLIPFPSPPAIRKVADDVFGHVAAAVDPPEVVVDLRQNFFPCASASRAVREDGLSFSVEAEKQVRVLRREAVGMYEVAVLDAGSAAALRVWMTDHGFRYPDGMDQVCEEYVELGWCFVAVRARVGSKPASDPRPGMRSVDTSLPADATFDGHVQAMGFRFRTDELVVPMRLSAFNEGELRNVVYVLTDGPQRIANLPAELVVRQVPGYQLYRNLTDPLPLRIVGGRVADIPEWRLANLPAERDPLPHSGIARELFAADLMAARSGRLAHAYEETEKQLLDIGERLGLRGPELDALHREALAAERERMVEAALTDLTGMTLTVVDGDFSREVIAAENLGFTAFAMAAARNSRELYDARFQGPAPAAGGLLAPGSIPGPPFAIGLLALLALVSLVFVAGRRSAPRLALASIAPAALLLFALSSSAQAAPDERPFPRCGMLAGDGVDALLRTARGGTDPVVRGRAIVALSELGGEAVERGLRELQDSADSALVRTWSSAALVRLADSVAALGTLSARTASQPVLLRPVTTRWFALLAEQGDDVSLESVLDVLARVYPLQQRLLPGLLERESGDFLAVMLGAASGDARRLAAACLATLAAQDREGLAPDVLRALRFDPAADQVPWHDGPLFLPSLSWTKEQSVALVRALVSWHLWCGDRGLRGAQSQIHNNLNSRALANAVGYPMPGRELDSPRWLLSATWLLAFGEAAGAEQLRGILAEQGLEQNPRYAALLILVSGR